MKKSVFLILAAVIFILSSALPIQADGRGGHGGHGGQGGHVGHGGHGGHGGGHFRSSIWFGPGWWGPWGYPYYYDPYYPYYLILIPIMVSRLSLSRSRHQFMYSRTVSKRSRIIGISVQSHRVIIRISKGAPADG